MSSRILSFDWAATSLGPIEAWPHSLKALVDVMLGSNQPMFVAWGPVRTLIYNDAYAEVLARKHPALGQDFLEVWFEIRADLEPLVERVYRGVPLHGSDIELVMHRRGYPERTHWAYSYTPVFDDAGAVGGFFCPCHEITGQVLAERRQRLLVELGQALPNGGDARAAMDAAVGLLGRHLKASRVGYGEVQSDDATVVLHSCYADGVQPLEGAFRLDSFGAEDISRQRRGLTQWSNDLAVEPGQDPAVWAAIETRSYASVPLLRNGRFVASLYVNFREPHVWTPDEIVLVEQVAARTWGEVERARAEERLRESEARLRTITDAIPAFVWFATPDGHLQYLNERWYEFTGQTAADALPDGWVHVLHPDDVHRTAATWAEALARGTTYENEVRYRRHDGAYRWYVARAEPLRGADGAIAMWFGTSTDIHDRRLAIERLELALDSGAIQGTWVWDVPADRVTGDERFAYTYGIDPDECRAGFPIARAVAAIHEEDRARVKAAIEAALAAGGAYRTEYRARNSDGGFRWVEASGRVELAADGTPLRFAGVAVDVEARRAIEAERDRATVLLKAFFETLPGPGYAKDREGRMLLGNPSFAALVGHQAGSFLGRTDLELFPDKENAEVIMENDRRIMAEGVTRQIEEDLVLPERGLTHWLSIKTPLKDADGSVAGIVGISLDMTERRRAEERMRLLAQEVDHRAKNLLGVVQSVVQLTRSSDVAGFKAAVTGRIRALARAHSLLAANRWEGVNIDKLVRDELAPFQRAGMERIRIAGPSMRLQPSASKALALTLHELATNGAKYGALSVDQGTLDVTWGLAASGDGQRLELVWKEDGGPPVAPPTREGFGSTVVRMSVERQLSGEIEFDWSPAGLRCRIFVPADQLGPTIETDAPGRAPKRLPRLREGIEGRRVLIVEDEGLISLELEQAVRGLGCEVVGPAVSSDGALQLIRARAPDFAILDLNLAGESSARIARALRALDIPFIYCTGYAETTVRMEQGLQAEIISKPIDREALSRAVRRAR